MIPRQLFKSRKSPFFGSIFNRMRANSPVISISFALQNVPVPLTFIADDNLLDFELYKL